MTSLPMSPAQQAYQFFTSKGWSPTQAAALVGNLQVESFEDLRTGALGDADTAYGIGQWRGSRQNSLIDFAQINGLDINDRATQLAFIEEELGGKTGDPAQKRAGDALRNYKGTDVNAATQLVSDTYFRPKTPHMDKRISYAKAILDQQGVDTTGWSPEMVEGALSNAEAQAPNNGILTAGEDLPMQEVSEKRGTPGGVAGAPRKPTLLGRIDDFLTRPAQNGRPSTGDALLALGSGLLSGRNWGEGFGAAGQNLLGLNQKSREDQLALDVAKAKAASAYGMRPQQAGNAQLPDGRVVPAQYLPGIGYADMDGNPLPKDSTLVNRSIVQAGQPDAKLLSTRREELRGTEKTLNTLDELVQGYDTFDQGMDAFANYITTIYKTLTDKGLSDEEIAQAVQTNRIGGLIGELRLPLNGPGPVTEFDAGRMFEAAGGRVGAFQNHESAKQLLGILYRDIKFNYDHGVAEWDHWAVTYPQLRSSPWKRSSPIGKPVKDKPGLLSEPGPDLSDDELFQKYLNP